MGGYGRLHIIGRFGLLMVGEESQPQLFINFRKLGPQKQRDHQKNKNSFQIFGHETLKIFRT